MKIAYKTEIKPMTEQIAKIKQKMNVCCWIYNQYIKMNIHLYKMYQRGLLAENQSDFMIANDFEQYLNRTLISQKKYSWLKQCDSYTRKVSLINAENAFKKFFQKRADFPKLKIYDEQKIKLHLKSKINDKWIVQRHRINIPTIGFVQFKEYGYLPIGANVLKGIVSKEASRYYICIIVEEKLQNNKIAKPKVINKQINQLEENDKIEKLIKKIKREKRSLNRKYNNKNSSSTFSNIEKQKFNILRLEQKLHLLKNSYKNVNSDFL